ncbi:MAG: cupin domain-containing protein [Paracoccus sp. (in: a-proteobacteria)]|nr:cupin domain-containing protein [Paracoccus sp. (in: a-proteobacteria)]
MTRPIVNIDEFTLTDTAPPDHPRFGGRAGRIGGLIGVAQLGAQYLVVPPGKAAFPRHNHHINEEMFVILSGRGEWRAGDDRWPVRAGDVIAARRAGRTPRIN